MPAYRLLLPLLAGCNWIYGLDSTKPLEIGVDAPPDLSDEDLDGTANEFDNCPGITNTDQRDRDNDGVGDACDLAPDRAGDRIVLRYMFNRPTFDPTEWDSSGWNFQDGYVEQPSLGGIATMFTKRVPDGTYVVIEARMRIRFDREKQTNSTHVIVDGVGGDTCLLTQSTVSSGLYLATGVGATAISALDPGDDIPFTLVMLAVRQPTMSQPEPIDVCRVGSTIGSFPSRVRAPDTVGLKTVGNAVRVDYLVVYAGDSLD